MILNIREFAGSLLSHAQDGFRQTSSEVLAERERACRECPHSSNNARACNLCGCGTIKALSFAGLDMFAKRAMASAECPLDEPMWKAER